MFRRWFIWCLALAVLGGVSACREQSSEKSSEQKSEKGQLERAEVDQNEFPLTIHYSQSLAEMVAAGHYGWTDPGITAEHFPIQGSGIVNTTVRLVHFNERLNDKEVSRRLDEQGLRSAILPELLAFGAKYPDKQKEFPIVALGSRWRLFDGGCFVAFLDGDGVRRDLCLNWLLSDFNPFCRFLVSSK